MRNPVAVYLHFAIHFNYNISCYITAANNHKTQKIEIILCNAADECHRLYCSVIF